MILFNKIKTSFSVYPDFAPWILFIAWCVVQGFSFLHYGVVESVDSDLYISNAKLMLQGFMPVDRGIWYSSYSLFLACIFYAGGSLTSVVAVQVLWSGIASIALYTCCIRVFKNNWIAFLSVLFYLLWLKIQQWNMYIYTESLFTSFCILSFVLLSMSNTKFWYILTTLCIAFTFFIRPNGICFLIAVLGYLLAGVIKKNKISKTVFVTSFIVVFLVAGILLNSMLKDYIYYFIDSYSKAEVIYPNISLGISTPKNLYIPSPTNAPLVQLILFVILNPLYFLKLSLIKCVLFFGNIKPYFSFVHNALIVGILYPIYSFAVYGIWKMQRSKEKIFMLCFIGMQTLTVSLTSENWDGRFLLPILPFIFIFSAFGIHTWYQKITPA